MILDLVVIGVAIALDPLPLTTFLIILPSKRGVTKGATFILGWLASLAVVIAVTVLATGNSPPKPSTAPSLGALAAKILIGVVLVGFAARRHRTRGRPKKPKKTPRWQAGVDSMSPLLPLGLAPLVQPWGLIAAGAATATEAKLSTVGSYVALFSFCLIATSSYLAMELYAGFRPEKSEVLLRRFRTWMSTQSDQVIIVGCLVLGFWLVGNSIYLIVS